MLRNRIELLERVLHSRGIDPDTAIQLLGQKDSPDREPDAEWAEPCSNVDDLCTTFDGALTLDESLNFDQDGEVRYFGPTSGRLLFRSSSKGESEMRLSSSVADRFKIRPKRRIKPTVLAHGIPALLMQVNLMKTLTF
jgi:hypothetical protein